MHPSIFIGPVEIQSFTALYFLAFAAVSVLAGRELAANQYPKRAFPGLMAAGIIFGVIGCKIYFILSAWDFFVMNPMELAFNMPGSGWYGGFILGGTAIVLFLNRMRLPILKTLDILAPCIAVGQVFGRAGCFLGGCCYGTPSNLPWAAAFPNTIYRPHVRVHPTQLYEMAVDAGIAAWLWRSGRRNAGAGFQLGTYLVLSGLSRFLVEFIRTNSRIIGPFTAPQLISLACVLIGSGLIFRARRAAGPSGAAVRSSNSRSGGDTEQGVIGKGAIHA